LRPVNALSHDHSTVVTQLMGRFDMPQYFFAIRAGKDTQPERAAVLKDDAAAFASRANAKP
jgi:hypothetical protein